MEVRRLKFAQRCVLHVQFQDKSNVLLQCSHMFHVKLEVIAAAIGGQIPFVLLDHLPHIKEGKVADRHQLKNTAAENDLRRQDQSPTHANGAIPGLHLQNDLPQSEIFQKPETGPNVISFHLET